MAQLLFEEPPLELDRHRFTVEDLDRMLEAGILDSDDKVELLEGEFIDMTPMGDPHLWVSRRLTRLLVSAIGERAWVNAGLPIRSSRFSEPEPDFSIQPALQGSPKLQTPHLVIAPEIIEMACCDAQYLGHIEGNTHVGKNHSARDGESRVAPGSCLPGAPTDPDVRSYRIRLFGGWFRCRQVWRCTRRARGSGYRCIRRPKRSHVMRAFCERRFSHLRQVRTTRKAKLDTALEFPVMPKYPK